MKTMTSLDFVIARKYLVQEAVTTIPIGVVVSFFVGNIYTMPAAFAGIIPVVLGFTLLALDEKGNWEGFRLALPLSRTDVIAGRYATCALLAIAGIAFGLAIYALTLTVSLLAPNLPNASNLSTDVEIGFALAAPCIGALAGLVMLAIVTPVTARYGMTKAMRLVPVVALFAICFCIAFASVTSAAASIEAAIDEAFASPASFAALLLIAIALVAVIYVASCALSCKLYQRREL